MHFKNFFFTLLVAVLLVVSIEATSVADSRRMNKLRARALSARREAGVLPTLFGPPPPVGGPVAADDTPAQNGITSYSVDENDSPESALNKLLGITRSAPGGKRGGILGAIPGIS